MSLKDPKNLLRAGQALEEALSLEGQARERFLEQLRRQDAELAGDVAELLADDDDAFLQTPIQASLEILGADAPDPWVGRVLGPYQVTGQIAEGGMGKVLSGQRVDGEFEQHVAIKVMGGTLHTDSALARFQAERQILANLQHPYIASLIDGGTTDDNLSYLVMELIDGEPIDVYCDRLNYSLTERLQLFQKVCEAVDHAHRNLVVHRDIKPSNILVTEDGTPKLLDFGIAKLLEPAEGEAGELVTAHFERALTLEYASPEQVQAQPVTTASDVYSLGVLLYRLLTGVSPYSPSEASTLQEQIREVEPPRPSKRLNSGVPPENSKTARSNTSPTSRLPGFGKKLRGDLDNIVMMALRKEPQRRYASVIALSDDLQRYQSHHPVLARPNTLAYISRRFLRRNRIAVAAGAGMSALLVGFALHTSLQNAEITRERDTAAAVADFLVSTYELAKPEQVPGVDVSARQVLDAGRAKIATQEGLSDGVQTRLLKAMGDAYFSLGLYEESLSSYELAQSQNPELAEHHPVLYALLLNAQAKVASYHGKIEQAENQFLQAHELFARSSLLTEEQHIQHLIDYGRHHTLTGARDAAIRLLSEAETLALALEQDPEGLLPMVWFAKGAAQLMADKLEHARDSLQQALNSSHPDWANHTHERGITLAHQADVYRRLGRLEQAQTSAEASLNVLRNIYGERHRQVGSAHNKLALILGSQQRFEEALTHSNETVTTYAAVLGEDHYDYAIALGVRARLYERAAQYSDAQHWYKESLRVKEQSLPKGHESFGVTYQRLGSSARELGMLDESIEWLEQARELYLRTLGPVNQKYGDTLREIATTRMRQGRLDEAEELLEAAFAALKESPPLLSASVSSRFAELSVLRGQCSDAMTWWQDVEQRYTAQDLPVHPATAGIEAQVVNCATP